MPEIYIKNLGIVVRSNPGRSLLNNFLIEDAPIHTVCGGHANCGCCRVKVLEGSKGMNQPNQREILRLGEKLVSQGWRLSCQSYCLRDIVVHMPQTDELDKACSNRPR